MSVYAASSIYGRQPSFHGLLNDSGSRSSQYAIFTSFFRAMGYVGYRKYPSHRYVDHGIHARRSFCSIDYPYEGYQLT